MSYYANRFRDQWEAAIAEVCADELTLAAITPRTSLCGSVPDPVTTGRIATRVADVTRVPVTAADVRAHDTVGRLASYVRTVARRDHCLQLPPEVAPGGPVLFYLHSASGNAFAIRALRRVLPVPLAGVRAAGLHGERDVPRTIEEFAEAYLPEIRRAQPHGPYLLCGFSSGGLVAFELATRLRADGADIAMLAMLDTDPPAAHFPEDLPDEEWLMEDRLRELLRRVELRVRDGASPDDPEVVDTLRRGHALADDMGPSVLRRQLLVYARSIRAGAVYRAPYYSGAADHFAAETAPEAVDRWRPHVAELRTHVLDAEHYESAIFADARLHAVFTERIAHALRSRG
ncbi:thioesterase domain-containing protein [Micromonospora sp. DT227]|uniref:thioesterase domain-containing protein n=1 Tax=Micromonospora sp. DT227 TaxID=3393433 RepID=UPI003CF70560